jgi:hypothetical protein
MKCRIALWTFAYAAIAAFVVFHIKLYLWPDTACYLRGSCAWSSTSTAAVGGTLGLHGIRILVFCSFSVLGGLLAYHSNTAALVVLSFVAVVPGMSGLATGPDAIGAAATVALYRTRFWPLVAMFHLEAGLVVLFTKAGSWLVRTQYAAILSGLGAVVALPLLGYLRHRSGAVIQYRYLLPAVALALTSCSDSVSPVRFSSLRSPSSSLSQEVAR